MGDISGGGGGGGGGGGLDGPRRPSVVSRMLAVRWGLLGVRPDRWRPRLAYSERSPPPSGRPRSRRSTEGEGWGEVLVSSFSKASRDWLRGGGGGFGFPGKII